MPVAIKLLAPAAPGKGVGYWELAKSIHPTKPVFSIDADKSTDIDQVKAKVASAASVPAEKQRIFLFGKELEAGRTLGSYGFGNIEDPLLHVIPVA
mmetsp:Transcript_20678/g.30814  ORF Transcript_20678/g.30814 Transcript_20678/m.30814 type:complete len:96 (-) Transcript_20678:227-514(-)